MPKFLRTKSLDDLKLEAVKLNEEIGTGSFGKVYRATRIDENSESRDYAAKVISLKNAPKDFLNKFLPRELELCTKVSFLCLAHKKRAAASCGCFCKQ